MARGKRTLAAGTYDLGAVGENTASELVVQCENVGGTVEVHGRAVGSGMDRVAIEGFEHNDSATPVTSIAADGLFRFPCGGLDLALVVAGGDADVAVNEVSG